MATYEELESARKASAASAVTPYQAETFRPAESQADSINDYYDRFIESQKAAQKSAYDENVRALEYAASKLPRQYKAQREALAADTEIANRNFRESAAARGLNTGAGSQAALARNNEYLKNMTAMRQAEMNAMADAEEQRRQATASYQNAVAEAIANGNLQRAKALYDEAVRVDESIQQTARAQAQENYNAWQSGYTVNRAMKDDENEDYNRALDKAETLAQYGDFSGYRALGYTDAQINAMYNLWWYQMYGGGSGGGSGGGRSGRSSGSGRTTGSGLTNAFKGVYDSGKIKSADSGKTKVKTGGSSGSGVKRVGGGSLDAVK